MSTLAEIELTLCWLAWLYPFVFHAPHAQQRASITVARPTQVGVLFEAVAIFLAFIGVRGTPPTAASLIIALVLGIAAITLSWTAVKHLGRQFRMNAGLYVDHDLVRTGPYALIRHPIYASLLAMLLATIVLRTPWPRAIISLVLFTIGTEVRVRAEDRLLASRFGDEFEKYRNSVRAYIPFVR